MACFYGQFLTCEFDPSAATEDVLLRAVLRWPALRVVDGEVIGAVAAGGAKIEQDVKATKAALAALKL